MKANYIYSKLTRSMDITSLNCFIPANDKGILTSPCPLQRGISPLGGGRGRSNRRLPNAIFK
jgi:hypothetical protein